MTNKMVCFLFIFLFFCSYSFGQDTESDIKRESIGYGWIVAISNNVVFIPAADSIRYPTIARFFEEENKYGFEIKNQFDPREGKPVAPKWITIKIYWGDEGEDNMLIIPVMAYYKLHDTEVIGRNQRAYKYQGKQDNVTYRIVSSLTFKYITLE